MSKQDLYRKIPKVDQLMERARMRALSDQYGGELVLTCVRKELDDLRRKIAELPEAGPIPDELDPAYLERRVKETLEITVRPKLRRVINATGTILHTNLGRAPISKSVVQGAAELASGYTNIEYNLATGTRGSRGGGCEELLIRLTGAEDALVVNNNAAAMLLILNTFCSGCEVVVSRGELVEIGGSFRMPDVMEAGGADLKEVGTTNKTHLRDYENAITAKTAALMKVHTSNYKVVGFTESVDIAQLSGLAHEKDLLLIEDLGSGALIDLAVMGIGDEPTVQQCVTDGADLVCFSADKLLGGPQAGIVLGRADLIKKMKSHPMMRALRVDKLIAATLERTLLAYLEPEHVKERIPVLSMITATEEELRDKAEKLCRMIAEQTADLKLSVEPYEDQIGGGSMPQTRLPGYAVRVHADGPVGDQVRRALLAGKVPIAARFADGDLWLSVRTVDESDFSMIVDQLVVVFSNKRDDK